MLSHVQTYTKISKYYAFDVKKLLFDDGKDGVWLMQIYCLGRKNTIFSLPRDMNNNVRRR